MARRERSSFGMSESGATGTSVALSVVIPTRDRLPTLLNTLDGLAAQDADDVVELIVVDNGSSDGTPAKLRERPSLVVIEEPTPGPAAARNRGIAAAHAPVILILGDDTSPASSDLLARHLALHRADPRPEYAVLGRVVSHPGRTITPFMRWLDSDGPQFAFGSLRAGLVPATRHFYTSHVSVKTTMLERAGGFDERYQHAAVEDIELGLRLERAGLDLDFHPELLVYHDHPYDPAGFALRQERVGESARLMYELHGEIGQLPRPHPTWPLLRAAVPVLSWLSVQRDDARIWKALAIAAYARGWTRSTTRHPRENE